MLVLREKKIVDALNGPVLDVFEVESHMKDDLKVIELRLGF